MRGGRTGVALLAVVGALAAAPAAGAEPLVASCEMTTYGGGPADWRKRAHVAGPLGVFRGALQRMSETRNGQLVIKMPVIVEGSRRVTLTVPPRQRHRVFLYHGSPPDRAGQPAEGLRRGNGASEVEFQPCARKSYSAWPGGIRVKGGRKPVRLMVRVEGRADPIPLRLGRPMARP